ncbi:MAG: hypothetical protein ACI4N3_00240 [Alphaproteobacteria bacterium]
MTNEVLNEDEINKICRNIYKEESYFKFKNNCPYKNNECGSRNPPSYCKKCFAEGRYNIKNGRSSKEFSYNSPMEMENSSYYNIRENHNRDLADECRFRTESATCKYKDYWEKCAYCSKEFSR